MLKPIIQENRDGYNDIINIYNPGKYLHTLGEYVQIKGAVPSKKRSHEYSDSDDSESSDGSDSESDRDDDGHENKSQTQMATQKDQTQTIEIKIITSNQP